MSNFESLGLTDRVLTAIHALGFEKPTQIQAQAIPAVLAGRDVIGSSQTGTGKTAAFAIPILTKIEPSGTTSCLVLEPTRELAAQVFEHFRILGKFTRNRLVLLHGGVNYGEQNEGLDRGADILIATPGRLLDHMQRGNVDLSKIRFLVLDETDRMLDMGFLPDVRRVVERCPAERQTLLFSATMPPAIRGLANWALREPLEIEVGRRQSPAETVQHAFYPVSIDQRDELLLELLKRTSFSSVMIFTRTKREADELFAMVTNHTDHSVTVLHSDIPQKQREIALRGFREGEFAVIIATDVAARGLDISGVSHVINHRVPENAEDYVHRIGRTGRAEAEGDAFTLLSADEIDFAHSIERFIGQTIQRCVLDDFDYIYTALLDKGLRPVRKKKKPAPSRRRRR